MPRISLSLLILLLSVLLPAPSTALYSARSDVVQVTEENFKEKVLKAEGVVLVEFYAAWCGHCKNLVPEWDKAATALKGVVTVAAVDASVAQSLAQKYDVKGFPTIKVFGAEKGKPVDYQSAGIVDFTLSWLEAHGAPPEVHQLLDSREYEDACSGPIICSLAALPHLLDTGKSGREAYLTTLLEVAKKNRKGPFRLFWTEGGAQPAAEEALGLTFGFPAVAALSKEKGVFATFKGSFNAESITSFLVGLTTGKEVTAPLPGGKLVVVPASAWDGKEAVVVEEEEFSLEDIMGEEL
ncbi:protein disulfide isomerase-like 2-3-like [Nannochloropsis oceanica]